MTTLRALGKVVVRIPTIPARNQYRRLNRRPLGLPTHSPYYMRRIICAEFPTHFDKQLGSLDLVVGQKPKSSAFFFTVAAALGSSSISHSLVVPYHPLHFAIRPVLLILDTNWTPDFHGSGHRFEMPNWNLKAEEEDGLGPKASLVGLVIRDQRSLLKRDAAIRTLIQ